MRPYRVDDLESIESMEAVLFPDNAFNTRTLAKEIELGFCYVVDIDGPVGYVLVRVDEYAERLHILRLGVLPAHRRAGWGRALLTSTLTRVDGYSVLLTVLKANRPAIALYRSFGFQVVGGTPGDPAGMFLMERR